MLDASFIINDQVLFSNNLIHLRNESSKGALIVSLLIPLSQSKAFMILGYEELVLFGKCL